MADKTLSSEEELQQQQPPNWGRGRRSPRVQPVDTTIRMDKLPDWHKQCVQIGRIDQKRAFAEAEKDDVERKPIDEYKYVPKAAVNRKISFWRGDITTLSGDSIVNAANTSLLGGGGIDGAIHAAAGLELYKECANLNGCNRGQAKITKGYKLPVKHVIHTVGPLGENPKLLISCYEACLAFINSHKIRTIALCGISTGIYGYPPEKAAHIALSTVRKWIDKGKNVDKIDRIVFVTYTKKETRIYEHLASVYFPPDWSFDEKDEEEDGDGNGDGDDENCVVVECSLDSNGLNNEAPSVTSSSSTKKPNTTTDENGTLSEVVSVSQLCEAQSVEEKEGEEKKKEETKASTSQNIGMSKAEKRRRKKQQKQKQQQTNSGVSNQQQQQ